MCVSTLLSSVCVYECVCVHVCAYTYEGPGSSEALAPMSIPSTLIFISKHHLPMKGTRAPRLAVDSRAEARKIQDEMSPEYLVVWENKSKRGNGREEGKKGGRGKWRKEGIKEGWEKYRKWSHIERTRAPTRAGTTVKTASGNIYRQMV